MSGSSDRLSRLATAQGVLGGLLEARLAQQELRVRSFHILIEQLSRALEGADTSMLVFHAAGLTRLADAEGMLTVCKTEAEKIRSELLTARSREKAFSAKAKLLAVAEQRKEQEEASLEAALHMAAKVSGKTGMVE